VSLPGPCLHSSARGPGCQHGILSCSSCLSSRLVILHVTTDFSPSPRPLLYPYPITAFITKLFRIFCTMAPRTNLPWPLLSALTPDPSTTHVHPFLSCDPISSNPPNSCETANQEHTKRQTRLRWRLIAEAVLLLRDNQHLPNCLIRTRICTLHPPSPHPPHDACAAVTWGRAIHVQHCDPPSNTPSTYRPF
jgi:hypothetical protein